jgi:hypothetical protein
MKQIDISKLQVVIIEEKKNINIGNIPSFDSTNQVVDKFILANNTTSLEIYAPDGVTLVAKIDSNGNLGIKGQVYSI